MNFRQLMAGVVAVSATGLASAGYAQGVTAERLLAAGSEAEAGNWLMNHKTYDSNRFSTLNEINASNVAGMRLAFAVPIGGLEPSAFGIGYNEATPLVDNGFMYVPDPWGTPIKIDVSSGTKGQVIWICDTSVDKDPTRGILVTSRGVALSGTNVITALNDGRVVACDSETGDIVWEQQVTKDPGEGFTAAPLVIGDKILVGQSYGDWATRGWLAALDAATGEEVWRFYTVPEPGQPGSETWLCAETGNPDCWKTGGGALWQTGSYDPATNTTYWGTGNPVPMFDPEFRPGDNLYTNSTLALDADSGELKWHFQYTPGDYMDYDEVGSQLLVNRNVEGEDRKVLAHFGRNGLYYSLDQNTGAYVSAVQYVNELTWTKGLDPKTGLPLEYDPAKSLQTYAQGALRREGGKVAQCPHLSGGVNFYPTAHNPVLGISYGAGIEGCSEHETAPATAPEDVVAGVVWLGGSIANVSAQKGSISAIDVATNASIAKEVSQYPNNSGVLATPELVFSGTVDGTFTAYDAKTLKPLWSTNVGTAFRAPPMTYSAGGKQYVAIAGGHIGGNSGGNVELDNMQAANMIWVFAVN